MMTARLNVLYIYSARPHFTGAVADYDNAFGRYSRHRICYFNADAVRLDFSLDHFDAMIFSFSFFSIGDFCMDRELIRYIREFKGIKIAIFQDEYDYFLRYRAILPELGVQVLVTSVPEQYWKMVYGEAGIRGVELIYALTGYVTEAQRQGLATEIPLDKRRWHIGYRGRQVPFRYGKLTQEKYVIGVEMARLCTLHHIPSNISVADADRIYGKAWYDFIRDCRAVLGTESSSNIFDFDGTLNLAVNGYLAEHPEADFDTVYELFLKEHEDKIRMNQISPRIFEAIAMKTGLVLFEGEYSGMIRPWEHYIPLKKDFSNVDEVFKAVENIPALENMIERAWNDIIGSGKYSYAGFVGKLDDCLERKCSRVCRAQPIFGIVAWRTSDGTLQRCRGQSLDCPTLMPMRHEEHLAEPVWTCRFNVNALQRKIFRCYRGFAGSCCGRAMRRLVGNTGGLGNAVRQVIRSVTGRS